MGALIILPSAVGKGIQNKHQEKVLLMPLASVFFKSIFVYWIVGEGRGSD